MKIAIASGKGGTGKTTIAANLAQTLADAGERVAYVDCDVEEPNGHLFLHPHIEQRSPVHLMVPRVLEDACHRCGQCEAACMFNAIACVGPTPLIFAELCHGCGACVLACPRKALVEVPREVGVVEQGAAGALQFIHGLLHVGQAMSPPVIRAVRAAAPSDAVQIIDAPPGTSCPMVAAVRDADFVVLVTEPTPFGLHDLTLAVDTMRALGVPFGVAINRADAGDERVLRYCETEGIDIVLTLPDDRRVAEAYARGELMIHATPETRTTLDALWTQVLQRLASGAEAAARRPARA